MPLLIGYLGGTMGLKANGRGQMDEIAWLHYGAKVRPELLFRFWPLLTQSPRPYRRNTSLSLAQGWCVVRSSDDDASKLAQRHATACSH